MILFEATRTESAGLSGGCLCGVIGANSIHETMKIHLHHARVLASILVTMIAMPVVLSAADDLNTIFQMGRTAYHKGDLEQAHELLSMVEARDPRHQETRILLASIRSQLKTGGPSLKKQFDGVKIAKVEFAEVTLQEALEALRVLAKNASNGKVVPNFIVKEQALNAKPLSMKLTDIPLTQAIQYVAEVAGARTTYDRHAVIFTSASGN